MKITSLNPDTNIGASSWFVEIEGHRLLMDAGTHPKREGLVVSQTVVTMRGCLEITVDQDQFRLTDTEGADTPQARSWRSGFLKKRSAPVDLVELSDPVGLRKYVGHRVVATGVLTGRELRVRSLQAAGTSCN